ncbi:methyl-accepting chemotaxis protein [Dactylosporangium cerinum]|uniref:Methyl-accepting chemotaxis protein n=1 Tax=Dactylosporangium cerinum TaxID=1434730 RepID=A0ABV9W416_9ACTN
MSTTSASPRRGIGDVPVGAKIFGAVLIVVVTFAVVVGLCFTGLKRLADGGQAVYDDGVRPTQTLAQLRADVLADLNTTVKYYISNAEWRAKHLEQMKKLDAGIAASMERYAGETADPASFDSLRKDWESYKQVRDGEVLTAADKSDLNGFWTGYNKSELLTDDMNKRFESLVASQAAAAAAEAKAVKDKRAGTNWLVLGGAALSLLLGLAVAWLVTGAVVGPLRRVTTVLEAVADGDLTRPADVGGRDEVGQMASALNRAIASMLTAVQTISASATALGGSSRNMAGISDKLAGGATQTAQRAGAVRHAAQDVAGHVQTLAAAAEEMGAAIREIASSAGDAAAVAGEAVTSAREATGIVGRLGESSSEIGNIVKVITSIAEQTNLLALNATIEAARAGDAGKGFAVVASEVKDLAQETARATEDIAARIQTIQGETTAAVAAIEGITQITDRISDHQTTIASAVEEQTATTGEISRSVSEAASGADEIARNIGGVADATESTSQTVEESRSAADALARTAEDLNMAVGRFRV